MLPKKQEKRYTAEEFYALDWVSDRAELIDGIIYDPAVTEDGRVLNMAPAPGTIHQDLSRELSFTILGYIKKNGGKCRLYSAPYDVRINAESTVQPDLLVVCDPSKIDEKRCNGAPDWIIEIVSPSSVSRDTINKSKLYCESGVREYWIVDPGEERVIVYRFGKTGAVGFYSFDDEITVGICEKSEAPLVIRIAELLG